MPYIQTNGITTCYEIHGEGRPLVFIHGLALHHSFWQPQINYFSKDYKVIVYDLRGHGASTGSPGKYTCALFAGDLRSLLTQFNIDKPVLCGISLGGMIAETYAVKYEGLHGLVLVDAIASAALTLEEKVLQSLAPKTAVNLALQHFPDPAYVNSALLFFSGIRRQAREYLKQEQFKTKREEVVKSMKAVYDFRLPDLARISAPTLVVLGERDKREFRKQAELMNHLIKDSKIVTIPGAGHVSSIENPDAFNEAMDKFLCDNGRRA